MRIVFEQLEFYRPLLQSAEIQTDSQAVIESLKNKLRKLRTEKTKVLEEKEAAEGTTSKVCTALAKGATWWFCSRVLSESLMQNSYSTRSGHANTRPSGRRA